MAGVAYTFTVTATNSIGTGPASAPSAPVTPPALMLATQSFDTAAPPGLPSGWLSVAGIGPGGAWRTCSGVIGSCGGAHNPYTSPHSGATLVSFNSYALPATRTALLISPAFSLLGITDAKVSFWVYRDADAGGDYVEAWWNNSANLTGATLVGTVYRYKGLSPLVPTAGWYQYIFDLPPGSGATNYLILNGVSGYVFDINIDDITIASLPAAPTLASTTFGNGSASVAFSPGDTGGVSASYTASCSPTGGGTAQTGTGSGSPITVSNLINGTPYDCTVAASNIIGTVAAPGSVSGTPKSSNANLSNLTLSNGTLSPGFDSSTLGYISTVANSVTSIMLTPTLADAVASVQVNGTTIASGSPSAAIALSAGSGNVIHIVVTAQDNSSKTYTLTITRISSNNADLSNLTVSVGSLSPAFAAGTLNYTDLVSGIASTVTVTPTVADAAAMVTVNGAPTDAGSSPAPIVLSLGNNLVTIVVTAQDGSTKTYHLTVTRQLANQVTLSVTGPASITYGNTGSLTYSGGSGTGAVTFGAGSSTGCAVAPGTTNLTITNASGSCAVTVSKAADSNYNAARSAPYPISIHAAAVSLSTPSLTFSGQIVNTASVTQAITLTNTGNAVLGIISILSSNPVFGISHNCTSSLGAGSTCSLNVTFAPTTTGLQLGSITLTTSAPGSPHSMTVSGNGLASPVPICSLSAAPARIQPGQSSMLTASCNPTANSYRWTGGNCAGITWVNNCTASPGVSTSYGVSGINNNGSGAASAPVTVTVRPKVDLTPILMLLLD